MGLAAGDFWVGANGNLYTVGATGNVVDNGAYDAAKQVAVNTGMSTGMGIFKRQIADPNAPAAQATSTNPTPAPTGGNPYPALDHGAVTNTQTAIDQIPGLLQAALSSEDQTFKNTTAGYDASQKQQQDTYDGSTVNNQQNYDSNFMDSIRAGIKGLGNLFSLLRGSGAGGGTAEDQVQDVVGGTTANDIRAGKDTHDTNQGALDSSLTNFLTDLKGKRQVADDTHVNNTRAVTRDSNTQLQDLYSKMAGYYGSAGQTGTADTFMSKAGALTPSIASNSKTQTSAYDTTPIVVHAPNLTAFAAPSQPSVATAPSDGQVGSGIFTINNNKRKDTATPTAPVVPAQGV